MRYLILLLLAKAALGGKFYNDDPLEREPPPRRVEKPENRKLSDYFDFFFHQFGHPGEPQPNARRIKAGAKPIRARAVNTLGEPIDPAWWVPRHYYKPMSKEELMRGPGNSTPPSQGPWTVVAAKSEGVTPGFVMIDANKRRYFVKFDPLSNPEIATAADSISSRLYYAMGYHVPQNYIVYFTDEQLVLGENVELADRTGKKRKMTRGDLLAIMVKVPKTKEGKYRGTASLGLPGRPIGPPRYFGTRSDDPNDTVPHEHRRDQRGLHVFGAWIGHDDSRAINNLDIVVEEAGLRYIRHYQLDFGSTLGSASSGPNSPRSGDYLFDWKETAYEFFSLGLRVPYWAHAKYPKLPSIGRFESKVFDPERWVPEYPNPAFQNRLPDDEFWAAKQAMSLTDDNLRALVKTGELSDPKAEEYLLRCLIERRDKIGKAYFAKVLPLDRFAIRDRELAWEDLSAKHGMGGVGPLSIQWSRFDNESGQRTPIAGAATSRLPDAPDGYYEASLARESKPAQRIGVFVRKKGSEWKIAGIDREW